MAAVVLQPANDGMDSSEVCANFYQLPTPCDLLTGTSSSTGGPASGQPITVDIIEESAAPADSCKKEYVFDGASFPTSWARISEDAQTSPGQEAQTYIEHWFDNDALLISTSVKTRGPVNVFPIAGRATALAAGRVGYDIDIGFCANCGEHTHVKASLDWHIRGWSRGTTKAHTQIITCLLGICVPTDPPLASKYSRVFPPEVRAGYRTIADQLRETPEWTGRGCITVGFPTCPNSEKKSATAILDSVLMSKGQKTFFYVEATVEVDASSSKEYTATAKAQFDRFEKEPYFRLKVPQLTLELLDEGRCFEE